MFHTYDSLPRVPHLPRMMMTWNFIRDDGDVMIINGVYTYIYIYGDAGGVTNGYNYITNGSDLPLQPTTLVAKLRPLSAQITWSPYLNSKWVLLGSQ